VTDVSFDVRRVHPDLVAYLDLQRGHMSAIVVQLELVLGFDEGGFGFRHFSGDPVAEFIDGFISGAHAVRLETHPREAGIERNEMR
jgi:hypothetical protein